MKKHYNVNSSAIDKKNRIKELQQEYGYTDGHIVARTCFPTLATYRNYKNLKSHISKIPNRYLYDLSRLYNVSVDYILGTSNDRLTDKDGITIPTNYVISYISKEETFTICENLRNNFSDPIIRQLTHNLYFLLEKLPSQEAAPLINTINLMIHQIEELSPYGKNPILTTENFQLIKDNLKINTPEFSYLSIVLASANKDLSAKLFLTATKKYLKVIYFANMHTESIAKEAVLHLKVLCDEWSKFPEELCPIVQKLDTFEKNHFLYDKNDQDILSFIKKYIGTEYESINELLESRYHLYS